MTMVELQAVMRKGKEDGSKGISEGRVEILKGLESD